MHELPDILKSLDLSTPAAAIYLAGLELGPASILDLARKSKVKRTTIYTLLEELRAHGLVEIIRKGAKDKFVMANPERLLHMEKERLQNLENIMPRLKAIWNEPAEKPKIRYLTGIAGWEELIEEIRNSRQPYLHISGSQKYFLQAIGQKRMKQIILAKDDVGQKRQVLCARDPWTKNFIKEMASPLREYRFLPENFQMETQLYLYAGNRVAFFSSEPELMIVIVENEAIYKLQEALFYSLWEKSTPTP